MPENIMKKISLEKITINIGVGESGDKLEKAKSILEKITGKKAVVTITHKRTTFGGARRKPIGVKTTLRGEDALNFLKKALQVLRNKLKQSQFDESGNFSFGIEEYINLPGVKYDPNVGIIGMDIAVTLRRPGFRISKRRIRPKRIGKKHRIKREESIEFMKKEFGVEVENVV